MAVVELKDLSKSYPGSRELAVDGVSLRVEDQEFMILLGPSGCGKSTTLRMIAGLESITRGSLEIDGQAMNRVLAKDRDIAMVFQSYALYPHMTVKDNLAFGLRRRNVPKPDIERRVGAVADKLGLTPYLDRKPHALSGGQRQRVALGRAIVRQPKVFLFDEPLSNLDAALRVSTRNELIRLHRELGATIIYVTHDQVEAMTMGTRICIMNGGRVAQIGAPMEVYLNPADTFVASFLGSPPMNLIPARKEDGALHLGSQSLRLSDGKGLGGDLVFGIRPEDLALVSPELDGALRASVDAVEPLGAETLVLLSLDGLTKEVNLRAGRSVPCRPGDKVGILPDLSAARFFNPETQHVISTPKSETKR